MFQLFAVAALSLVSATCTQAAVCSKCEAVVAVGGQRVRVQMLSPTLVRMEINRTDGSFEDR